MATAEEILKNGMLALKKRVIYRHQSFGQVASGRTRDSFEIRDVTNGVALFGNLYSGVLERGRRPGKVPSNFIDIIKRWAQAKGLSFTSDKEFERFANAVMWNIRRNGTKLYSSGQTKDIFTTPYEEFKIEVVKELADFYEVEFINKIFEK